MFGRGKNLADVEPAVKREVKEVPAPVDENELGVFDVVFGGRFNSDEYLVCTYRVLAEGPNQAIFVASVWLGLETDEGLTPEAFNDRTLLDTITGTCPVKVQGVKKVLGLSRAMKLAAELGL